jgi:hypothetical protein
VVDRRGRSDASRIAQSKQMLLRVQLTATKSQKNLLHQNLESANPQGYAKREVGIWLRRRGGKSPERSTPSLFNHDTLTAQIAFI